MDPVPDEFMATAFDLMRLLRKDHGFTNSRRRLAQYQPKEAQRAIARCLQQEHQAALTTSSNREERLREPVRQIGLIADHVPWKHTPEWDVVKSLIADYRAALSSIEQNVEGEGKAV